VTIACPQFLFFAFAKANQPGNSMPSVPREPAGSLASLFSYKGALVIVLIVYVIGVIANFATAFRFMSESFLRTFEGSLLLLLIINIAYLLRYSLIFGLFLFIGKRMRGLKPSVELLAGIILCSLLNTLVILISLFIPGFSIVEFPYHVEYSVTSLAFALRDHINSVWVLQGLSAFEIFNFSTLIFLSLYLRSLSGFGILRGFTVNFALDLALRFVAFNRG
jgi:hypothetical protein